MVDCNKIDKEDYLLQWNAAQSKILKLSIIYQNALVDEINSHEIFMKSINIIYYHEGYTEYNIEDL